MSMFYSSIFIRFRLGTKVGIISIGFDYSAHILIYKERKRHLTLPFILMLRYNFTVCGI